MSSQTSASSGAAGSGSGSPHRYRRHVSMKILGRTRVADPHSFHPDPGPDPGPDPAF